LEKKVKEAIIDELKRQAELKPDALSVSAEGSKLIVKERSISTIWRWW
jgi:hypothetical protein